MNLIYRRATIDDLNSIISLLAQDKLGQTREKIEEGSNKHYLKAFEQIERDPHQYLMVVTEQEKIIATCQLTLIPSLTFMGSMRMQIEGVRVHPAMRGQEVGQHMIEQAIKWGKEKGASIIQLTTNKERKEAINFYEKLGFSATHEGMKLYLSNN